MIIHKRLVPANITSVGDESSDTGTSGLVLDSAAADRTASGQVASRFVVRTGDRALMIAATDVDWIEGARNYVVLHVKENEYRLRATLQALQERLDTSRFTRIHKSVIVNVDRIREIQPWFGGDYLALLRDGKQLRVSRTYARELLRPIQ